MPTFFHHLVEGILSFKHELPDPSSHYCMFKDKDVPLPSEEILAAQLTHRGAHLAFVELSAKFGPDLFDILPEMWECMYGSLLATYLNDSLLVLYVANYANPPAQMRRWRSISEGSGCCQQCCDFACYCTHIL